jgi:hypothetical protein
MNKQWYEIFFYSSLDWPTLKHYHRGFFFVFETIFFCNSKEKNCFIFKINYTIKFYAFQSVLHFNLWRLFAGV